MTSQTQKRFFRLLAAGLTLLLVLAAARPLAPAAQAASSDWDRILQYDLTVTPNADGTLDMRCHVQWQVLNDDDGEEPLLWVQIGIPNGDVWDVEAEPDAPISDIYANGSYMHVYFTEDYYQGDIIDFAFRWTQGHMYTLGEDGSVHFSYTPGWFDEICVQDLTVQWNYNRALFEPGDEPLEIACEYATEELPQANTAFTPLAEGEGVQLHAWDLDHGATVTLDIAYPYWPAELSPEEAADKYDEYYDNGIYSDPYYEEEDDSVAFILFFFFVFFIACLIFVAAAQNSWEGGFGPTYVQVNHLWYPAARVHNGVPEPGVKGLAKKPPSGGGFGGMGGGSSHGAGGSRGHSSCACVSSCACACACACAGGGRAGCSAKNIYQKAVHMPAPAEGAE